MVSNSKIASYLSLIKFAHSIFALPFALIGFFLGFRKISQPGGGLEGNLIAAGQPNSTGGVDLPRMVTLFFLVIGCMVFARSAAMAFNRYLDRHFDAKNPRTAIREIPAGIISEKGALRFTVLSCILFLITCFFINRLCFALGPVALLVILFYSYTKRFTPWCHLILGVGLSLAPIGAYLAVTGQFAWLPILFSLAVICWVSGFDIIYALQDEEFDKSQELHSFPAWLGKARSLHASEFLHLGCVLCVLAAGVSGSFGFLYWIGALAFTGMLIYQHLIVKPGDLSRVNLAFMTANGIASVVFAFFVVTDIFVRR